MQPPLKIQPHLSQDELHHRYRSAHDPVERSHFQIIWLFSQGKATKEIAGVTGYSINWIRVIAHRYDQDGPPGLGDRRHRNPGGKSFLSPELQIQLRKRLQGPAPDNGVWTGRKVAGWLENMTDRKMYPQRGWDYLKKLGFVRYSPRPRHMNAEEDQQGAFKRDLPMEVANVQQAHLEANVEVWACDEHRVGLKPILRRVWALKGHRPIAVVQQRYQWLYVYGFVAPESGQTQWLLLPTVNVEVFALALTHFAQEVGANKNKHIVLVLDRAGWHTSPLLTVPEGLHLVFLPPYSPELQPAERLWSLSNEPLVNRHFQTLDELQEVQAERCVTLQEHPEIIRAYTHFHWWPSSR